MESISLYYFHRCTGNNRIWHNIFYDNYTNSNLGLAYAKTTLVNPYQQLTFRTTLDGLLVNSVPFIIS